MTADAITPRNAVGQSSGRVADSTAPAARTPAPADQRAAHHKSDRIELSDASRTLQEQITRDMPPASELPPARLSELLRRLNSGYYDKPEVVHTVVSRLTRDL